ncbi:hypothetical protein GCM10022268_11180 [Sphingomonas cynarae]|uniref:Uncharacterized protein n=1 Tax=Sphingomonas cynarae TaxID=930197 RepID=A0ABP7DEQ5_9SPHN
MGDGPDRLRVEDISCVAVQDWPTLLAWEGFRRLTWSRACIVTVPRNGAATTTHTPIQINKHRGTSSIGAPSIGHDNPDTINEFGLL